MDLDLKAFSLTLAVGLTVATIVYAALRIVRPARASDVLRALRNDDGEPLVVPVIVTSVLLLAVGIVCEDLSKNAVDFQAPVAFGPQLRSIMPSEIRDRCEMLLDRQCEDFITSNSSSSGAMISVLGYGVWDLLCQLTRAKVATPEEARAFIELQPRLNPGNCPPVHIAGSPVSRPTANYDASLRKLFSDIYYIAKNTDYKNGDLLKELEALRLRYDFERSVVFVLLAGIYFISFVYLVEATRTMWRDVGGWKTGVCLALIGVLVVATIDVVVSPTVVEPYCKEDSPCATARNWLLPATLLFVCAYRTRRLWRRAAQWALRSVVSTIPGPPLLSSDRERQAGRMISVVMVLAALLVPTDLAYKSDQTNYLKRVFGYYTTLRGAALHCDDQEKCEMASTTKTRP